MKKLALFFSLFLIAACKKNDTPVVTPDAPPVVVNAKKHKVTFTVSGFTKAGTPVNSAIRANALKPNVIVLPADDKYYPKIMYAVYDSTGTQVSRLEENLSPDDMDKLFRIEKNSRTEISNVVPFGTVTDSLKAGNYTVVIMAGTQRGGLNNPMEFWKIPLANNLYPELPLSEAKFYPSNDHNPFFTLMDDAFIYKAALKVSATNIEQTVAPEQTVGKVSITIQDVIPGLASYLRISIDNELYTYNISKAEAEVTRTDLASNNYGVYDHRGETNHTFSFNVLNTQTPFTLKIESYQNYDKIFTRTIPNVRVNKGQTTQISTKLFSTN
ncbi:hypothetical protein AAFN85_11900 [Mucilaginibacter sp. CAU 1740]|uniref:hypothetical protein n=1 Tax=Mucilaginibacter sp. CAU 1740 TaxID=3140365 RepID=UPI00325B4901